MLTGKETAKSKSKRKKTFKGISWHLLEFQLISSMNKVQSIQQRIYILKLCLNYITDKQYK